MYNKILRRVRVTIVTVKKTINITYSEYESVALVIQHTTRMRRIIFSPVACPAVQYFSTLSHKRLDFSGKVTEHKMCVLIFFTNLSETFPILRIIQRQIIINERKSACKVNVIVRS